MNISPTTVEPSSLTFLQGPHAKGNSAGYVRASFDALLGHVLKTKEKGSGYRGSMCQCLQGSPTMPCSVTKHTCYMVICIKTLPEIQKLYLTYRVKNHILQHEVHPQNLVAHWVIIHPCFSMTEFLSVASRNDRGNQLKKNDGSQSPQNPKYPHQWQRQGLTVNKLKSKDTVLNTALLEFIP